LLTNPNDIVGVGRNQFYVTNIDGYRSSFMRGIELLLRLASGNVVYYDGKFAKVADRIAMANGIAVDPARKRLYVAAFRSKKILAYAWDSDDPSRQLNEPDEIPLGTSPDNLEWDQVGDLWIGAHPSFIALLLFMAHLKKKAPSQVIHLRLTEVTIPTPEEVFRDDGTRLSASSVAAMYATELKRRLVIGALDDHCLVCDVKTAE
jgi:arylesterase/paraoxonase